MKPHIQDIFIFIEVVETRSFTAAADRLGKTKSAISQAVTRLERDLGYRLLFRSTRSLSLTEAGSKVFTQGQDLKATYEEAITIMSGYSREPKGTLSITAPHALCSTLVAPTIAKFVAIYPQMKFRLIAEDAHTDLVQSQIDLAIRVGSPLIQTAKVSKLGVLRESLFASPDYLQELDDDSPTWENAQKWRHIANEWQGNPITYKNQTGEVLRMSPHIRCNAFPDIMRLVMMGAGVARLPDMACEQAVSEGRLTQLFPLASTPVSYLHLFPKRTPAGMRRFIALLREQMKQFS